MSPSYPRLRLVLRLLRWKYAWKCILFLLLVVFVIASGSFELKTFQKWISGLPHTLTEGEIGLTKCPVCYGFNASLCRSLLSGEITVNINSPWTAESIKGVSYGKWKRKKVVVKYLGTKAEISKLDKDVCHSAGEKTSCNLQRYVWKSMLHPTGSLQLALKNYIDCPSRRFMERVQEIYGKKGAGHLSAVQTVHLMTTLHINQEILLLQVFPQEDGWPFPKYYGVCGRVMVVENAGRPLSSFLTKPWGVRAKLAIDLIRLGHQLTVPHDNWALYIGDASAENFGVSETGDIKLLDLEHVIVVDLKETDHLHANSVEWSKEDKCDVTRANCLSYSPSDMCKGGSRDHNYYAICRGVLADVASRKGLLHSPPVRPNFGAKLKKMLQNCVSGKNAEQREDILWKISGLLKESLD